MKMSKAWENALKGTIPSALKKVLETKSPEQIKEIVDRISKEYPLMIEEFLRILDQMFIVFALKQNDYGPSNIALGTKLGNQAEINAARKAVLVRTFDKLNRMINLEFMKGGAILENVEPTNEPLMDAWEDTSVYSVIAQLVMRGVWGK